MRRPQDEGRLANSFPTQARSLVAGAGGKLAAIVPLTGRNSSRFSQALGRQFSADLVNRPAGALQSAGDKFMFRLDAQIDPKGF
jgi:hypothetical protein